MTDSHTDYGPPDYWSDDPDQVSLRWHHAIASVLQADGHSLSDIAGMDDRTLVGSLMAVTRRLKGLT